jgi:CRP-like cAMP-binding protein
MTITTINKQSNSPSSCGNNKEAYGIEGYISEENFKLLKGIMYPKKMETGNYLFWEGDAADYLYFIRSGRVKLLKSTEDGKDMIMSIMQKGDLIMEMGGFNESQHQYSAELLTDTEVGVIQRKDLEILLYRHGDFAIEFMSWMSLMHRMTQSKFRDLLLYGKTGALASTLIRLTNSFGIATPDGIRIDMKLTNSELADIIGATRESVNRMLGEMKEAGTISIKSGHITVRKLSDLRHTCHCPTYPECPVEICRI